MSDSRNRRDARYNRRAAIDGSRRRSCTDAIVDGCVGHRERFTALYEASRPGPADSIITSTAAWRERNSALFPTAEQSTIARMRAALEPKDDK